MFCQFKKMAYLCKRYPENNLFTLKRLIPIEDMKRRPVKVIALFFVPILTGPHSCAQRRCWCSCRQSDNPCVANAYADRWCRG